MLKIEDVLEILSIPLLGIIPESQEVLKASNLGTPVRPCAIRKCACARACRSCKAAHWRHGANRASRQEQGSVQQSVSAEGGMNLRVLLKRDQSAPVARDRLQVLLDHERSVAGGSDLIAVLREEVLAVIKKHIPAEPESVQVRMDRGGVISVLEIEIEVPTPVQLESAACEPEDGQAKKMEATLRWNKLGSAGLRKCQLAPMMKLLS